MVLNVEKVTKNPEFMNIFKQCSVTKVIFMTLHIHDNIIVWGRSA